MQPSSLSVPAPVRGAGRTAFRAAFVLLGALLVAALAEAQPPKEPEKKEEKKEPKWPLDINGKDIKAVMKDMEDPDPTIREFAARTLPNFGPPAQRGEVSKLLLKRMVGETDPGVRFAVWQAVGSIAFDAEADNKEALRILANVVDTAPSGGSSRYQAVQAIAMFGPKAEPTITALTGIAAADASYETRRTIAGALGRAGFNETTGPNMKALTKLADTFSKDVSAAVRMEALQALLLLGPPWDGVKKKDDKANPPINTKSAAVIIQFMKHRVGDPKLKLAGLEKDKQVEIWARLVLMRFDPKEINEDNLEAFARHLTTPETGVKIQALQAIAMMGETGARKIDAVVRLLWDKEQPLQLTVATVQVLQAMGGAAKPALPELRKFLADTKAEGQKIVDSKKKDEKLTFEDVQKKQNADDLAALVEKAIKHIEETKVMNPVVETPKKP